ncbi:MAG TPA: sodium:solute symporter [Pyrinomonadaceae bacterium]|nr:sodium:solute symporter [Pyrinomonadaceae bacterium]HMP66876.1 sodium:solute symporter [Pyrinomonadaceae bacterium]
MSFLDWAVVVAYLAYVIFDGIRLSKNTGNVEGFFLANRSLPWWAVGLSVMATQMSAITLVGTTGQAYADGMRFLQFYYGMPLAMVILCVTVVPFFSRARVFTAYEYLEKRFDAKTRSLTSFAFLLSRGLGVGVIIAAPSVVLSIVLGWSELATILLIGMTTTFYTMIGGVQAVTWTDVKQMILIFIGLFVCVFVIVSQFPAQVTVTDGLFIAGALGKLETVDLTFDLSERFTFWSGAFAALFLFLAYFGCDQSQVQRFLTAKNVDQGRTSLLMSAVLKIPMQFMILLIGIFVFVFYQFVTPPMIFNTIEAQRIEQTAEYPGLKQRYTEAHLARSDAALAYAEIQDDASKEAFVAAHKRFNETRVEATELVKATTGNARFNDVNYVFPTFVVTYMPIGILGLIIAAIFAAAMSSISSELNALATATTIDFYRRHFRPDADAKHFVRFGRVATFCWGAFACVVATYATNLGSLIEVVNRFGSFFYGSLLGVFVLAIGVKRARGRGAFSGILIGLVSVFFTSLIYVNNEGYYLWLPSIPFSGAEFFISLPELGRLSENPGGKSAIEFLWLNVVGCVATVVSGYLISLTVTDEPGYEVPAN